MYNTYVSFYLSIYLSIYLLSLFLSLSLSLSLSLYIYIYIYIYIYVYVYVCVCKDKETFIFYLLFSNLLTYIRINFFLIFHNTNRKFKKCPNIWNTSSVAWLKLSKNKIKANWSFINWSKIQFKISYKRYIRNTSIYCY